MASSRKVVVRSALIFLSPASVRLGAGAIEVVHLADSVGRPPDNCPGHPGVPSRRRTRMPSQRTKRLDPVRSLHPSVESFPVGPSDLFSVGHLLLFSTPP
jgi:hypothetical protein